MRSDTIDAIHAAIDAEHLANGHACEPKWNDESRWPKCPVCGKQPVWYFGSFVPADSPILKGIP